MKAHVWYGPSGIILAVGSPGDHASLTPGASTEDVKIIEVNVADEDDLNKLHETHRVDVESGELVRQ